MTAQEIFNDITVHSTDFYAYGVTIIEDIAFTPTWTHIAVADTAINAIWIIKP